MDPYAERSLCAFGFFGWPPNINWNDTSNYNAPSLNVEPGELNFSTELHIQLIKKVGIY